MKTWASIFILLACSIGMPLTAFYLGWFDKQDCIISSISIFIGSLAGNLYLFKQKKSS